MEFSNKTSQNNDGEGDGGVVRWWESERKEECVCVKKKRRSLMAGQKRERETF